MEYCTDLCQAFKGDLAKSQLNILHGKAMCIVERQFYIIRCPYFNQLLFFYKEALLNISSHFM